MTVRRSLAIALAAAVALAGLVTATTTSAASGAAPAAQLQPRAVSNTTAWAAVKTLSLGVNGARDIAVNGLDDTVYVVNGLLNSDSMSVINGTTGLLDDTIPLPGDGYAVAVDQNDDTIYTVSVEGARRVQSRSGASPDDTVTDVSVANALDLAVDSQDDTVYVSRTSGNDITYFSGRTPANLSVKTVGGVTYGIAVDQLDDSVWMSFSVDDSVRAWNAGTNILGGFIGSVGTQPDAVAVNGTDDTVYVADGYDGTDRVFVVDGRTNTRVGTVSLTGTVSTTNGLAVDDATARLFAVARGSNRMFVINGANTDDSVTLITGSGATAGSYLGFSSVTVDDSGPNRGLVWAASPGSAPNVPSYVQAITQVTPVLQAPLTGSTGATVSFTVTPSSLTLPFDMDTNAVWGVSFDDQSVVTNVSRVNATTWSVPLPSGLPAGDVPVEVYFNGNQYARAGTYTVQSSTPPAPTPVFPPGAPTDVKATAGSGEASVSWTAPTYVGSYPITDYEVTSSTGSHTCLTKSTSCTITGLTGGTSYTFTVRALNGAGWGAYSSPSNAVTPSAPVQQSIVITGSRDSADARFVQVQGTTTDLSGKQVTPYVRFPGQTSYKPGTGTRTVASDGTFTWQRKTGKRINVYFQHESIRSNAVVIPARWAQERD